MGKLVTKRGGAGRGGSASGRHFTSGYPYASSAARAQAAAAAAAAAGTGSALAIPRPPPPPSAASVRRTGSAASLGAGTTVVTTTTVGISVTETTTATTTTTTAGGPPPAGFDWAAAAMGGPYSSGGGSYTFYRPSSPYHPYYAHHFRRLKRLDFVASCGADLAAMAAAAYRAGRALWPALLAQPLAFVEGRVASAAAPLLAGAAYRAERLLELADAQVDGVVAALGRVGEAALPAPLFRAVGGGPARPALPAPAPGGGPLDLSAMFALPQTTAAAQASPAPSSTPHLRLAALSGAARALYLDQVRGAAEAVKAVSGAPASARAAADAVVDLLAAAFATTAPGTGAGGGGGGGGGAAPSPEEADEALARVADAFAALLATPAVAALLAGPAGGLLAGPPARYARDKYLEAHGALVGSVGYERALSAAAAVLGRLQGSGVYRAAAARLSPLAEPYLGRVARTPAARAVVQHLRPTGGAGGRGGGAEAAACPPRGRAETPPAPPAAQCAAARG